MKCVIPWSGGPDSTACLEFHLKHTDHEVMTFYMRNTVIDPTAQAVAIRSIEALRTTLESRYRPFEFIVVDYRHSTDVYFYDHVFPASYFLDHGGGMLCLGYNKEDADAFDDNPWKLHHASKERAFAALGVTVIHFNWDKPKAQIRNDLGALWSMTTSCITPEDSGKPCGTCLKCKERQAAEAK